MRGVRDHGILSAARTASLELTDVAETNEVRQVAERGEHGAKQASITPDLAHTRHATHTCLTTSGEGAP